jgi:hypothetical protein
VWYDEPSALGPNFCTVKRFRLLVVIKKSIRLELLNIALGSRESSPDSSVPSWGASSIPFVFLHGANSSQCMVEQSPTNANRT